MCLRAVRVCSTVIVQANVTGLTEAAEKVAHLGVPKVSMSFKLDRNGIVRVQRAEATIEEIIPPAPEEEEEQAAAGDDEDAAGRVLEEGEGEAQGEGTAANDAEGDDKAAEGGDKAAEGDDKAAEGDDKAAEGDDKTADAKDADAKPAKKKAKKDNKPTKKVHRFPLTITLDKEALAIKPLEGDTLLDAKARLQQLDAIDDERKQREEAKNGLESFAYTTRDKFEEYEEQIEAVTTSEQREAVSEKLSETTEWLYDEGEDATFDEYQARRTQLELLITPIMSRVAEAEVRDTVVADAFEALDGVAPLMEKWAKEKPQVSGVPSCRAFVSCHRTQHPHMHAHPHMHTTPAHARTQASPGGDLGSTRCHAPPACRLAGAVSALAAAHVPRLRVWVWVVRGCAGCSQRCGAVGGESHFGSGGVTHSLSEILAPMPPPVLAASASAVVCEGGRGRGVVWA